MNGYPYFKLQLLPPLSRMALLLGLAPAMNTLWLHIKPFLSTIQPSILPSLRLATGRYGLVSWS